MADVYTAHFLFGGGHNSPGHTRTGALPVPAEGSLLAFCLELLLVGAGAWVFAVLAVKIFRAPERAPSYLHLNFRLALVASGSSLVCALLFVRWFVSTSGGVQLVLSIVALTGFVLAVLAVLGWTFLRRRGQRRTTRQ